VPYDAAMDDEPDDEQAARFDLQVPPEVESGVYANFLNVWHTAHEFTLDFATTLPAEPAEDDRGEPLVRVPARVTARVKVPPTLLFDVIRVLNDNMTRYEATFGPIARLDDERPVYPPDES
jgi:hypothetical protein